MQKDELKSLVTEMYEELLVCIDTSENLTKRDILNYLRDASQALDNIYDKNIDSSEHAKEIFKTSYKEIAEKSLKLYKNTNQKFEDLTKIQKETLAEHNDTHIDYQSIKQKFDEVQEHMSLEINKANGYIDKLKNQIQELEESSNLDPLTKVFNRRALTSYLTSVCDKGDIQNDLHLLILDIDDFKLINDTHGHIAGDKVLIFIANLLRKTLREGDKVFRYGGEEFIITLNRVGKNKCREIGERILTLIKTSKLIYKGVSLNVTMSIGATHYYNGDVPDRIIARADKALYRSKHNGKNQISVEPLDGV